MTGKPLGIMADQFFRKFAILGILFLPGTQGFSGYQDAQDILKRYVFYGDFSEKEIRPAKKYPYFFKLDTVFSPLDVKFVVFPKLKHTAGHGPAIQALNNGISIFRMNKYQLVIQRLTEFVKHHEKTDIRWKIDFLIGMAYYNMGLANLKDLTFTHIKRNKKNHDDVMMGLSYIYTSLNTKYDHNLAFFAFYNLILGLYSEGHHELCYRFADRVLREFKMSQFHFPIALIKADLLVANKDFRLAVEELDKAIRFYGKIPGVAQAFYRVAEIYFFLNNYLLADEVFKMAMLIDPQFIKTQPILIWDIAESKFWMGDDAGAIPYYMLLKENFLHTVQGKHALMRLGDSYLNMDKMDKAEYWYQRSNLLHGGQLTGKISKLVLSYIKFVRKKKLKNLSQVEDTEMQEYLKFLQDLEAGAPRQSFLGEIAGYYHLQIRKRRFGLSQKIIDDAKDFILKYPTSQFNPSLRPDFITFLRKNFDTYYQQKKYGLALSYYEKNYETLYKDNTSAALLMRLLAGYWHQKDDEKVQTVLKQVAQKKIRPNERQEIDAPYHLILAEVMLKKGDHAAAAGFIKKEVSKLQAGEKRRFAKIAVERMLDVAVMEASVIKQLESYLGFFSTKIQTLYRERLLDFYLLKGQYRSVLRIVSKILEELADGLAEEKRPRDAVAQGNPQESKKGKEEGKESGGSESVKQSGDWGAYKRFLMLKAEALNKLGRIEEVLVTKQVLLKKFSELKADPAFLFELAELAGKTGKREKQIDYLRETQKLDQQGMYGQLAVLKLEELQAVTPK